MISLDVFAVHGVGGIIGSLLVAGLATEAFSGGGLAEGMTVGSQFMVQLSCVVITFIWTAIASLVILKLVGAVVPLRVSNEVEIEA